MTTVSDESDYRKSSFSGTNSSCVEVRRDLQSVRTTMNRTYGDVPVPRPAWATFMGYVKEGNADLV
ncbi:DUF397 domain-containing protein [Actinophytocola sp.]|uniref:DUF397 domain-containing protein n=1 Tax=Actinophytocola sp. TaxID=1872138 RepID=UPI002D5159C5|nr:DUF397 domain-containing protein [Actinophytocola sp.]HYQ69056.1 DUF397 domain-containing protein [Actinophytocola sp.]